MKALSGELQSDSKGGGKKPGGSPGCMHATGGVGKSLLQYMRHVHPEGLAVQGMTVAL